MVPSGLDSVRVRVDINALTDTLMHKADSLSVIFAHSAGQEWTWVWVNLFMALLFAGISAWIYKSTFGNPKYRDDSDVTTLALIGIIFFTIGALASGAASAVYVGTAYNAVHYPAAYGVREAASLISHLVNAAK